jgi:hypothetical protein
MRQRLNLSGSATRLRSHRLKAGSRSSSPSLSPKLNLVPEAQFLTTPVALFIGSKWYPGPRRGFGRSLTGEDQLV